MNVEDRPGIEPCLYIKKLSEQAVLPVRECGSAAGYNMTTSPPPSPAATSQNKLLVTTPVEHCFNSNMNVGENPGIRTLVDSKETAVPRILRRLQRIKPYQWVPPYGESVEMGHRPGIPLARPLPVQLRVLQGGDPLTLPAVATLGALQKEQEYHHLYILELEAELREVLRMYSWYVRNADKFAQSIAGAIRIRQASSTPWPSRYDVDLWIHGTPVLALALFTDCAASGASLQPSKTRSVRVLTTEPPRTSPLEQHPLFILKYCGGLVRGVSVGEAEFGAATSVPSSDPLVPSVMCSTPPLDTCTSSASSGMPSCPASIRQRHAVPGKVR